MVDGRRHAWGAGSAAVKLQIPAQPELYCITYPTIGRPG